MRFIADLHLHSPYSRACSKRLTLENLDVTARKKGIKVLGTGDFTHPAWFDALKRELEPAEPGLYSLKKLPRVPGFAEPTRFLMQVEISLIYKHLDKVRKIHHVILMPSLKAAEELNTRLGWEGNLESDGRPILGMTSEKLAGIVFESSPEAVIIPAHAWTPYFAIFGSKSGYDSVEECFGKYTDRIFALETGLSSDPEMNRLISSLDKYTLVSGSDSHSPERIGREANVFDTELSYEGIIQAIKQGKKDKFPYTIEFYPHEGRYHYDGHRDCKINFSPEQTRQASNLCPKCGRPLTLGVMYRVSSLADRKEPVFPADAPGFKHLVQLDKIMAESLGMGLASQRVKREYDKLIEQLGPELEILQDVSLEKIEAVGGARLAEGVRRVRAGELTIEPGYDGEYGIVQIFSDKEKSAGPAKQKSLF
jgi:uncharacterized protein (TIGR00375 family)